MLMVGRKVRFWDDSSSNSDGKKYLHLLAKAMQGDATAQSELGFCYFNGYGVTKDKIEAVSWYTKAAEQGHATAQYNLGYCYSHGFGIKKDYAKAIHWYTKAATQGHTEAQNQLKSLKSTTSANAGGVIKSSITPVNTGVTERKSTSVNAGDVTKSSITSVNAGVTERKSIVDTAETVYVFLMVALLLFVFGISILAAF